MPGFQYIAYDLAGREQRGVLECDSARLARAQLRERGLFPLEVIAIRGQDTAEGTTTWTGGGLSGEALARLTRQLATLIGAGLTVEQAFNALVEQAETERERRLLAGVRAGVREGRSLALSMAAFPRVFSELYCTLVGAGESSGKLGEVLLRLADYEEEREALKQKLVTAMIYPAIVMAVSAVVVMALMVYVVPQVVGVFEATRQVLPLPTRALLALSRLLAATWWLWAALAVLGLVAARIALRREPMRQRWHAALLGLPLAGRLIRVGESARLAATLSILVGSGVPMLTALNAGVGVIVNLPMRQALQRAAQQVREGLALSRAMQSQQGRPPLFPPVMLHLIASGEASGRLPETLAGAARQQQRDLEQRTARLAAMIEPIMIVIMGAVVLAIVLAVLLPIFELNQLVAR